jgi:hypothetical protein
MTQPDLKAVKEWARSKVHDEENCPPPWEWLQYMKLIEAIEMLMNPATVPVGMTATRTEDLLQSAARQGNIHRLKARNDQPDISQRHQDNWPEQPPK